MGNGQFTIRESECLFLLVRGQTAKEIALVLDISPRTVQTHFENIKLKLNVSSRSQIIAKVMELDMLDIVPKGEFFVHLFSKSEKWGRLIHAKASQ